MVSLIYDEKRMSTEAVKPTPTFVIPDTIPWYESNSLNYQIAAIAFAALAAYSVMKTYSQRSLKYAVIVVISFVITRMFVIATLSIQKDEEEYLSNVKDEIIKQRKTKFADCYYTTARDAASIHALALTVQEVENIILSPYLDKLPGRVSILFLQQHPAIWAAIIRGVAKNNQLRNLELTQYDESIVSEFLDAMLRNNSIQSATLIVPINSDVEEKVDKLRNTMNVVLRPLEVYNEYI